VIRLEESDNRNRKEITCDHRSSSMLLLMIDLRLSQFPIKRNAEKQQKSDCLQETAAFFD